MSTLAVVSRFYCTFVVTKREQNGQEYIQARNKRLHSSRRQVRICLRRHSSVIYHEALNMLGVKMPVHEVFVPIDYTHDLSDNLDMLMNKLLEKYPQLTD